MYQPNLMDAIVFWTTITWHWSTNRFMLIFGVHKITPHTELRHRSNKPQIKYVIDEITPQIKYATDQLCHRSNTP
jgi:hypothetical protein